MTQKTLLIGFFFFIMHHVHGQENRFDSLNYILTTAKRDTNTYNSLRLISWNNMYSFSDTALLYAQKAFLIANDLEDPQKEAEALLLCGTAGSITGNYPLAIEYLLKGLRIEAEFKNRPPSFIFGTPYPMRKLFYVSLANSYSDLQDYAPALYYYHKYRSIPSNNAAEDSMMSCLLLSSIYEKFNKLDSALLFGTKAYALDIKMDDEKKRITIPFNLGNIYYKKGDYTMAWTYYHIARQYPRFISTYKDVIEVFNGLAATFLKMGNIDSSTHYAQTALPLRHLISYPLGTLNTYSILTDIYKKQGKLDSAMKYMEQANSLRENLFNQQKAREVQNLSFTEQIKERENITKEAGYRNQIKMYILGGGLIVVLFIAGLLWRNNKSKQRANLMLKQQKAKVESTLSELKSAQAQLIQSEKMASLGELTAGIAHEIQNPLNFVNNFSEVNRELISELVDEVDKGHTDEIKSIAADILQNSEKINLHGKRADAIVKGMLQHSRTGTGQKESTDINALANEYLRLAYHGLRAKDKNFNATINHEFDPAVDKINIMPQEIGRVFVNLINNAFYAVNEKAKQLIPGYQPTVTISTKKTGDHVQVRVTDNGNGIPNNLVDKIFQPFFTTKPTGQGTGLGLSLSYDIVKAHGGDIRVKSEEGQGTEFVINLPS